MEKTFVLDTNVLIHDPQAIYSFADNRVILPMKVVEELDHLKTLKTEVGRNARSATREIDQFRGSLREGSRLPNGGKLQIVVDVNFAEIPHLQLNKSIADNEIVLTALFLKIKGHHVRFVSKDLNARIKGDALGLISQDYEKQKVVSGELYTGFTILEVEKDAVDNFYKEKLFPLSGENLYENQYFQIVNKDNPNQAAIGRYSSFSKGIIPLSYLDEVVWGVTALNREQRFAYDALLRDDISVVTLVGLAGTGKTLLAIAAGLKKTLDDRFYKKLLVARPIMPLGKDIGYLPGSKDEKLYFWMQPIFDNLRYIFSQRTETTRKAVDAEIKYLMDTDMLELEALTYIRGRSIPKTYIIIDEAQNLTPHEIKTLISRAGEGTKIVLTGDPYQIDNPYLDADSNGLSYLVEKFKGQNIYGHITLTKSERSKLASIAADLL